MPSGWSTRDDEQAFVEALIFLKDGTAYLCFHGTGHGNPAILAIEILQIDNRAYYYGNGYGQGTIFRTDRRLSCGSKKPKFGSDYNADRWGGDRFWNSMTAFEWGSVREVSTENEIKRASRSPNFYPESMYRTALVSSDETPNLEYTMEVEPSRNYSLWLHFAEIDSSVTGAGQRVFDVLINGDVVFGDVDVVAMSGGVNSALVLNATVAVSGRSLTVTLRPTKGDHAIISVIELLELVLAESKTLPEEIRALHKLKDALGLPLRFGWNGDPCAPEQHPWSGVDCQYDTNISKHVIDGLIRALHKLKDALGLPLRFGWNGDPCAPEQHPWSGVDCQYDTNISKHVIDGLVLDNQVLRGVLPDDISQLRHLQSINLSGNGISGVIPSSLGNITRLEILDMSYNDFNGSIPESIGRLTSLRILDLNGNSLSGRVPAALGGRLLHGASFNSRDHAPYAKARTQFNRDVQMTRHHHGQVTENAWTAVENGPSLLPD
ncbi:hypothetical protein OROGR_001059 [Orobanche gracilis]